MTPEVRAYLELLVEGYEGKPVILEEAQAAWSAVPLDQRMRIHEAYDFETKEETLAAVRAALGLAPPLPEINETPELDEGFFENAVLTLPEEDILEALKRKKP